MENFKHKFLKHLQNINAHSMTTVNGFLKQYKGTQMDLVFELRDLKNSGDIQISGEFYQLKTINNRGKRRYMWTLNDFVIKAKINPEGIESLRLKAYHHKSANELFINKLKEILTIPAAIVGFLSSFYRGIVLLFKITN